MVEAYVLHDSKSETMHHIKWICIYKSGDGFLQVLNYFYKDKDRRQTTIPLSKEELDVMRGM